MSLVLNTLYLLLLLFVSPWVIWQSWKHGRYRVGWREKFLGPSLIRKSESPVVWLHAVSVGEVQVLRTIVEMLESRRPDLQLVISVTTDSGMELAKKLYARHAVFFTPLDFTWAIRRTFRNVKPDLIVLAELELWPNWLMMAEKSHCPVVVINGRLSEKSFRGYSKIPVLVQRCMRTIDWVGAQSETYADRFVKLGVPAVNVLTTGNTKFDGATGNRVAPEVISRRRVLMLEEDAIVLVAGSTQDPEESLILRTFIPLLKNFPKLKLILVPRHAERFTEVAEKIEATGLPWAKRSLSPEQVNAPNWQVFLGDSVGELRWWWGLADIGFVGGSFGDRGGQNMIEPCAYGVATCFGPNTKNFADIVRLLLDEKACTQLASEDELKPWLESMLSDAVKRQSMATRAIETCRLHRGASERTWKELERFLP